MQIERGRAKHLLSRITCSPSVILITAKDPFDNEYEILRFAQNDDVTSSFRREVSKPKCITRQKP